MARCRLVEGWLAGFLLSRRSWLSLGFVRLGDYANERLGVGARILEEEGRVVQLLQSLPNITAAFLDGSLPWTALRLIVGIARPGTEDRWLAQARTLDTRSLHALVRAEATRDATCGNSGTGLPARQAATIAAEEGTRDDRKRWEVPVSSSGRRLWRAACEMAERTAGCRLSSAQVLEQVAAEASSGLPMPFVTPTAMEACKPQETADDGLGTPACVRTTAAPPGPRSLAEAFAPDSRLVADGRVAASLPFLTAERAQELDRNDPDLAAFYRSLLEEPTEPAPAKATSPASDPCCDRWAGRFEVQSLRACPELEAQPDAHRELHGGSSLEAQGVHEGEPLAPESSAPRGEWFRDALRSIARTEGFAWLQDLPKGKPCNSRFAQTTS